jgi:hypothetical protein
MTTPSISTNARLPLPWRAQVSRFVFTLFAALGLLAFPVQSGRSAQLLLMMDIHQAGSAAGGNLGYYAFSFLNTTNTPITYDQVYSPNTNFQGGVGPGSTTIGAGYGTLQEMVDAMTNGQWTLIVNVGDPSQLIYRFSMSATNLTTNAFAPIQITFPTNNSVYVTNNPMFTWVGTNNWPEVDVDVHSSDYSFYVGATLPPSATNWNAGQTLNDGTNSLDVTYFNSNAPTVLSISTPTNNSGQSPAGWAATNRLFAGDTSQFSVGLPSAPTNASLVAHYTFDDPNNLGADSSGNGYNLDYNGDPQGSGVSSTTDAVAGGGSAYFDGGSVFGYTSTPTNVLSALAGSFGISFWLKTTDNDGNQGAPAFDGDGIVTADLPGVANDLVPAALTGGEIAFNTGNTQYGYDDTINSSATVNDNTWHHVVVTRNQQTGEKDIYIDGVLDTSDSDTTALLNDPKMITIGAMSDASQSDPNNGNYSNFYFGDLDDLQIYSQFLTASNVAYLDANPGSTLSGTPAPYPVDVEFTLSVVRKEEFNGSETYLSFPSFNSISPSDGTNFLTSPNGEFTTESDPSGGYSSSYILGSLGDVLDEWTNGVWTLYVDQNSTTQQVYTFTVSVTGLDTNFLEASKMIYPLSGSANVSTTPTFTWSGPSTYTALNVGVGGGVGANLAPTATSWTYPQTLSYGTNNFSVTYSSNDYPNVTISTPVDAQMNPVRTWTTHLTPQSTAGSQFVVGANGPQAVHLVNVVRSGGGLQFAFTTVAGRPHTLQSRTNLSVGSWIDLTNFTGDGTPWQFRFPTTNPPVEFFRVKTQ